MPFINSKVTTKITREQEITLKEKLGKAIELIPEKSEEWLMLAFEPEVSMYFRGKNGEAIAYVDVSVFGEEDKEAYARFTDEACGIFRDVLGIKPENIFITYHPLTNWGWNHKNF